MSRTRKIILALIPFVVLSIFLVVYYSGSTSKAPEKNEQAAVINGNTNNTDTAINEQTGEVSLDISGNLVKNDSSKTTITHPKNFAEYLSSLSYVKYTFQKEDTIAELCKKYQDTCTLTAAKNILQRVNKLADGSQIQEGTLLYIPETELTTGKLYKIQENDTLYSISRANFPNYDPNDVIGLLKEINKLPDDTVQLGQNIFLPNLK